MGNSKFSIRELKSIHIWIRDTSKSEVFFVSLLVFPLFLSLYTWAVSLIGLSDYIVCIIVVVAILYFLSIIIMKINQSKEENMEINLSIIKNHSKSFKLEYIGFEKLMEIDKEYTKEYLKKLIRKYPYELIIAKFEKGNKVGLKILQYSILVPEPTI